MGSENGQSGQFRAPHLPPSSLSASSSTSSSVSAAAAPPASSAANTATGSSGVWGADMHPSAAEFLPQSFSSQHSALPVAPFPAPLAARMFPVQSIYRPDFTQSDRYYPAAASRWGGGAFASGDDYYDGIAEENEGEWAEDALDTYIDSLDTRDAAGLGPGYYYDGPVGGAACNEDLELEPPAPAATFNWTQIEESCQRMEEQHMRIMEVDLTCIGDGNGGEQVLYEFTFEETDDYAPADAAAAGAAGDSAADGAADGTAPPAAAAPAVAAAGAGSAAAAGGEEQRSGGGDELPWYFGNEGGKSASASSGNSSGTSGNSSGSASISTSNSNSSRSGSDGLSTGQLRMEGVRGAADAAGGSASGSPKTVLPVPLPLPAPSRDSVFSAHGRRGGSKSTGGGGASSSTMLSGLFRNIKRRCSAALFSPSSSFSSSSSTSSVAAAAAAASAGVTHAAGSNATAAPHAASRLSSEAKTAQGSIKQRVFGSATGRWRRSSKGPRLQRCNSLT